VGVRRTAVMTNYSDSDPEARSWLDAFWQQLDELGWS
jgi:hypothetical protein